MDKKILIMVLAANQEAYKMLMTAQICTWAHGVDPVIFYYGGQELRASTDDNCIILQAPCSDDYYLMHEKFKYALNLAMAYKWDLVFRINTSCYVNRKNLAKFVEQLPNEKLYAGWTLTDSNDDGGLCVSGSGIFLSRDCAEILAKEIPEGVECEEDVLIGRILRKRGIVAIDDRSRVDYPLHPQRWQSAYHVRFKSNDRKEDANKMFEFHHIVLQQ